MTRAVDHNFVTPQDRLGDRWMLLLAICLAGYAIGGRGFAYFGLQPFFIGEACLLAGLFTFLATRGWMPVMRVGAMIGLMPLIGLGFYRLSKDISYWKIEAVRDAVVWGYAAFALVVASLIVTRPERLPRWLEYYRKFTKIFLIAIAIAFLIYRYMRGVLPSWPGVSTPILQVKEGDAMVHLAGVLAFWMADPKRSVRLGWAVLLTLDVAMMGVIDRAGLVAFGGVLMLCMIIKPFHGAAWRTIAMFICGAMLLYVSQINIEVPGGKGRNISWEQFVQSGKSIFGQGDSSGDESNKEWRVNWWKAIIGYTFDGPYFWSGKGFGINLADDDGFQVNADKSLRSPHSVHMTILARMGVPGLICWAVMHLTWMFSVGETYLRARRRGQEKWAGVMLFLFAYYLAFMINGSFDVFIEGPMGGIWFWSIFGTGVGALWVWRNCPHVLADDEQVDESSGRAQLLPAAGWGRPSFPVRTGLAQGSRA